VTEPVAGLEAIMFKKSNPNVSPGFKYYEERMMDDLVYGLANVKRDVENVDNGKIDVLLIGDCSLCML
jgi:hypothetical protein